MKRIRLLFAIPLLIMALPLWRYMDILSWVWPNSLLYSVTLFFWGAIFIAIPAILIRPKLKLYLLLLALLPLSFLSWHLTPLSGNEIGEPEALHCGALTYTGIFYHLRVLATYAHQDDLEARNQLCWIKKMIQKVPSRLASQTETHEYLKIVQDNLLKPRNKFRSSLPLVALLFGNVLSSYDGDKKLFDNADSGTFFVEGLQFWIDQYTVEISSRTYPIWNWPHSSYIQYEYGLIEKNWEDIVQGLRAEN